MSEKEIEDRVNLFLNDIQPYVTTTYLPEKVSCFQITFNHSMNSKYDEAEFTSKVHSILDKFGAVVEFTSQYHRIDFNEESQFWKQGYIYAIILTEHFLIPLAYEAANEFSNNDYEVFQIPNLDPILLYDSDVTKIIDDWLDSNGLNIFLTDLKYTGPSKDVKKAYKLLLKYPIEFPFRSVPIPPDINLQILSTYVNNINRSGKKWVLNYKNKILTIPLDVKDSNLNEVFETIGHQTESNAGNENDDNKILGDFQLCGDMSSLYNDDGKIQSKNYCRKCIKNFLVNSCLKDLYDDVSQKPRMDNIFNNKKMIQPLQLLSNQEHSTLPFGQMIFTLSDDTDLSLVVRTYITSIAIHTLKNSPLITYCPAHQQILYKKPYHSLLKCKIEGCNFILCPECNKWHKKNCGYASCSLDNVYYHLTSKESAELIKENGFKCSSNSNHNMLGDGIYFTDDPKNSLYKIHEKNKYEVLITAKLNLGKIKTEEKGHLDWNCDKLKQMGYDSVQMLHCKTGPEIVVYQPNQVRVQSIYYFSCQQTIDKKQYLKYVNENDPNKTLLLEINTDFDTYLNSLHSFDDYEELVENDANDVIPNIIYL